jgi:2-polyprenyl-6-methoxyphenol hydroxylase-like FAD-dependent oxidoreductase
MSTTLYIAICGAGIAGLTAAIALLKHPNIKVQIYEQATELKEIGASIALAPNGLRTLERLGLENAVSDEVGYRGPSNIPMIYKHWKTNEILGRDFHDNVTEHTHQTARYLRAHLQEALLKNLPIDVIHLGKKFRSVEVDSEGVRVSFQDGSMARADIFLGADGLRSVSCTTTILELQQISFYIGRQTVPSPRLEAKMEWMDSIPSSVRLLSCERHPRFASRLSSLVGSKHQFLRFDIREK